MNTSVNDWNFFLMNNGGVWRILAALLVLIVGLAVAKFAGKAIQKSLSRTPLDNHGRIYFSENMSLSSVIGSVVKGFLVLVTLLIVLELLRFSFILNPFVGIINGITAYVPLLLGALLLAAVAHIIATIAKRTVQYLLGTETAKRAVPYLAHYKEVAGSLMYALILLLFAPNILDALQIKAISEPIGMVVNLIINYLPMIAAALILIVIGHFIAKFVSSLTEQVARSLSLERWTGPEVNAPVILGRTVYFLILFPIAVQALSLLHINAIQEPAQRILDTVMSWIPRIAIAAALIYVGYLIARIVYSLALTLLSPLKIDEKLARLLPCTGTKPDLLNADGTPLTASTGAAGETLSKDSLAEGKSSVSHWISCLISVLVFGFFLVEATNLLGLQFISSSAAALLVLLPRLVLAAIIIYAGIFLGELAERKLSGQSPFKGFMKPVIVVLAAVIGLTEVGLASIIVTSGFMFVMGALAVAFMISAGIGSIPAVKRFWERRQQ